MTALGILKHKLHSTDSYYTTDVSKRIQEDAITIHVSLLYIVSSHLYGVSFLKCFNLDFYIHTVHIATSLINIVIGFNCIISLQFNVSIYIYIYIYMKL